MCDRQDDEFANQQILELLLFLLLLSCYCYYCCCCYCYCCCCCCCCYCCCWSHKPSFQVWLKLGQEQLRYRWHWVCGDGGWWCKVIFVSSPTFELSCGRVGVVTIIIYPVTDMANTDIMVWAGLLNIIGTNCHTDAQAFRTCLAFHNLVGSHEIPAANKRRALAALPPTE